MKSLEDLKKIREEALKKVNLRGSKNSIRVVVGMATCGIASGARPVLNAIVEEVQRRNLTGVEVAQTGCIGMCSLEPIVEVYDEKNGKTTYIEVDVEKAKRIVVEHVINGQIVEEFMIKE